MIDFKADDLGDLVLGEQPVYPKLNLNWRISAYPVLRVDFLVARENLLKEKQSPFSISFKIDTEDDGKSLKADSIYDTDELKQRIKWLLRTELGEISTQPAYGTELAITKHLDIASKSTIAKVKDIVLGGITDIVEDPSVIVLRKIGTGTFYANNLNIYIYSGEKLLYDFSETI